MNIEQQAILRSATKAILELTGLDKQDVLGKDLKGKHSSFYRFEHEGDRLSYSPKGLTDRADRLDPYNYSIMVKRLHSLLTRELCEASAKLAGDFLCLTHRIGPGQYLPNGSDCTLSSTAIEDVEVEGGNMESGLVYRPQLTDGDYGVEDGDHGYSAVELGTTLVANVKSLCDESGDTIDKYSNVNDKMLVQYDGMYDLGDGRLFVGLRVCKDDDDDELYQLPCAQKPAQVMLWERICL